MRWAGLIFVVCIAAGPAFAQSTDRPIDRLYAQCFHGAEEACETLRDTAKDMVLSGQTLGYSPREMLNAECRGGVGSACVRLRLLEKRMRENGQALPDIAEPTLPKPVVITEEIQTPAADSPATGTPAWVWFVGGILIGVFSLVALIWYLTNPKPETPRPITPPLPLPKPRAGERAAQGNIPALFHDTHQIVPWDRTEIDAWLDEQIEIARPLVTDKKLLSLLDPITQVVPAGPLGASTARDYLFTTGYPDASPKEAWENAGYRLFNLMRARQDITGGAYVLGTDFTVSEHEFPDWVPTALMRMDADKDFQPSAINLHDYLVTKDLYAKEDGMPVPAIEAYLRHHFNIGAPDGYTFLASHLLDFYIAHGLRPDHGYVAAAMRRIKANDPRDYQRWISYLERRALPCDLDDQSVDADGLMKAQFDARKLGTH